MFSHHSEKVIRLGVNGSALLGVLWLSCATGLLSVSWLRQVQIAQYTSKQISERLSARVAAHGVINHVIKYATNDVSSVMMHRDGQLRWPSGNTLYWHVEDEQARIPLNLAMEGALEYVEPRRDAAEVSRKHSGLPAGVLLEELLQAWSADVRSRLASLVTVYGNGKVNVLTASAPVLIAMGLPERIARDFVTWRNGVDGEPGTRDDQRVERAFERATSPSGWPIQHWQVLQQHVRRPGLATRTSCYRVTLEWRRAGSNVKHTMIGWVQQKAQGKWFLINWQEEPW